MTKKTTMISLPWCIALVLCGGVLVVLSLFLNTENLLRAWVVVSTGSFIAALSYNIVQMIVFHKDKYK